MSTPRFKKHKSWIGKDLTIHIGGGDRKIKDHDVLEGAQWAKFVGMGFLTQIAETPEAPKAAAQAAPAPQAPPPSGKSEGSVTKSSAGKVGMGHGKGQKKAESSKEPEVTTEGEPKADSDLEAKSE